MEGPRVDARDTASLELLGLLGSREYHFVTVTPVTHARIVARRGSAPAETLRDVFGWNVPFEMDILERDIAACLEAAELLIPESDLWRSAVRVSTVDGRLYLHSGFPTSEDNAVFLGPDSYRFANLISDELVRQPAPAGARIVDIGTGAGVGAIIAADRCPGAELIATDINPQALRLARLNARAAGAALECIETEALDGIAGSFDLALLNPPYMVDEKGRAYRDGGGMHGGQLSLDLAEAVLPRLNPGGRLILYTGSAIAAGEDVLGQKLAALARDAGCAIRYREIDPDVFGEELIERRYAGVDRIAVVSAIMTRD